MDEVELASLQSHVLTVLSCYNALNVEAQTAHARKWHAVPKMHMFEHIADCVAPQVNPAFTTCYADEDVVGHCAKTGRACHRFGVSQVLLERWRLLCAYRWNGIDDY